MIHWGIIGAGDVATFKGGPALQQAPGSLLHAVMRRDPAQAAIVAKQLGASQIYTTVEALLADPLIDAVYIATPVAMHYEHTLAAARAGKHVLVEKPMALNAAQCREMIAACQEYGVQLAVAYYRRMFPLVERMQELLAAGAIGTVQAVRVQYATSHVPSTHPHPNWRLQAGISGGGCLADVGSHRLDLLLALLGPVRTVHALLQPLHNGGVEYEASVHMELLGGAHAWCQIIWGSAGFCDEFDIIGSKGRLFAHSLDAGQLRLTRGREVIDEQLPPMQPTHLGLVRDVVAAFEAGHAPAVSGAEGMATTALLDACYQSAREQRVITLESQ